MRKIILDTNFLVYCAKKKLDYVEDIRVLVIGKYDLVVPSQVIVELEKIKETAKKYSDKEAANLALRILKVNKTKVVETNESSTDRSIVKLSKEEFGNIVATVDLGLIKRVNKTIVLRGRGNLAFK